MKWPKRILISRTDNLGDVVLTLPMAGVIKRCWPDAEVSFLGQGYVKPLVDACQYVDHFLDAATLGNDPAALERTGASTILHVLPNRHIGYLAQAARMRLRIGTRNRWHHWLHCTQLIPLGRKNSDLHEAQLNLKLLRPLGLPDGMPLALIPSLYGLAPKADPPDWLRPQIDQRFLLVLHPLSRGSARNWPLTYYTQLARLLPPERFHILLTGTEAEGNDIRAQAPELLALPHVTDTTGRVSLAELIALLNLVDGMVAASTGPLHIAAALGRPVLGLFPPLRPMHPGRWAPIGTRAEVLVRPDECPRDCQNGGACACMQALLPAQVAQTVEGWYQQQQQSVAVPTSRASF